MRFIIRTKIFGHDLYARCGKRVQVDGVNSTLSNGESVLFWEFDDTPYEAVLAALSDIQESYLLPPITLLMASVNTSWHATCWARIPWLRALSIVAQTEGVDPNYVRLAAQREHFTLRMTDKGRGAPKHFGVIDSNWLPSATPNDLISAVTYGAWVKE